MSYMYIYTAINQIEAALVKGLLESNGIETRIIAKDTEVGGAFPTGATTRHLIPWEVYVKKDKFTEAQIVLKRRGQNPKQSSDKRVVDKVVKAWTVIMLIFLGLLLSLSIYSLVKGL